MSKLDEDLNIIGIGSEYGGVEAINQFFKCSEIDKNSSFVICQYGNKESIDNMMYVLRNKIDLTIKKITNEMKIEKNIVYVVPENKNVEVYKNIFKLYNRNKNESNMIDIFFNSLAKEKENKSIGVILSGNIIDGANGSRCISEKNGIVIVQNEKTSQYTKTIKNVIATGVVDYVLPPNKMIEFILSHINMDALNYKKFNIDANYILKNKLKLAEHIMKVHYDKVPCLKKIYTDKIHAQCIKDIICTFNFLKLSLETNDDELFEKYIHWLNILLVSYNVPTKVTKENFEIMLEVLNNEGCLDPQICILLNKAIKTFDVPYNIENYKSNFKSNKELCEKYLSYLLKADDKSANDLILSLYKNNMSMQDIYLNILQPVMNEVGQLWQRNLITVTQEHFCSSITKGIIESFSIKIQDEHESEFSYLGACVSNELHELGCKMVCDFFKLGGWKSYYLGANTPTLGLIKFIKDKNINVLGLSASMMIHVEEVKNTIELIRKDESCKNIKIIVGGYIFNQSPKLYKYVGANGLGKDAKESYDLACEYMIKNKLD